MDDIEHDPSDEELAIILRNLIAQNYELGQRIIGLQSTCAALIAELSRMSPDPQQKLLRFNAELTGLASGVAERFNQLQMKPGFDTREITSTIDLVTRLAEEDFDGKWRRPEGTEPFVKLV